MQNFDFAELDTIVSPYYGLVRDVQQKSFQATIAVKDMFMQFGTPLTLKPRAKGSLISDCVKMHLELALAGDPNAKIIEVNGIPGLLIKERVFIRFNKMDEKFHTSIQKRKHYWPFVNQGEQLDGLPPEVILLWAAFIPVDKQWSDVARYFLVCFDAGRVIWFNNLDDNSSVEQLSIDITPPKAPRRTKIKGNENEETGSKTGTDNRE